MAKRALAGERKPKWQPSSACPPEVVVPPKAAPFAKEAGPPPKRPPIREGVGGPLQERGRVEAPPDPTDAAEASASSGSGPPVRGSASPFFDGGSARNV